MFLHYRHARAILHPRDVLRATHRSLLVQHTLLGNREKRKAPSGNFCISTLFPSTIMTPPRLYKRSDELGVVVLEKAHSKEYRIYMGAFFFGSFSPGAGGVLGMALFLFWGGARRRYHCLFSLLLFFNDYEHGVGWIYR